VKHLFNYLIVL